MIPKAMEAFLRMKLPESTWQNRLHREHGKCYMEFSTLDTDRLARLGIEVDKLGPRLVVCMWDETSELELGGYLVVDNLAMGRPSMGGIRMLPDLTPCDIYNLARGMTLKNAAANLPYGGGKAGIVSQPNLPPNEHRQIIEGFARLLSRYKEIYLPGPDVGTNDEDMKSIAIQNGIDHAVSKPVEMGGNRIDRLGAAAGGVIIALMALLDELPRLQSLPHFTNMRVPEADKLTMLIQGFGAVGAHVARLMKENLPQAKVTGISDALGYLYAEDGLPVDELFQAWQESGPVSYPYFKDQVQPHHLNCKYSNTPNDLLRESAFCLVPASPVANYLDTDRSTNPCMTTDSMGSWDVIIEGANTYSPDPAARNRRARMEREVYRQRGTLIATDYLVNSGGVIFAAQEHIIKTPLELRIPQGMLGDTGAVENWLATNSARFSELAEMRRQQAEDYRDKMIRRNMQELVDLLLADNDLLPCEAAEQISIRRIASSESERRAADLMVPIPTISIRKTIREAAALLVEQGSPILAVLNPHGELAGVLTEWDITRATAVGAPDDNPLEQIITRKVITAAPTDTILDMIRKLEYHEISAMPIVENDCVLGMITADLLARRSLLRLIQSQSI